MDRPKLLAALIGALLFASTTTYAESFQWTDSKGRIHFGDRPPEHIEARRLEFDRGVPQEQDLSLEITDTQFELSPEGMEKIHDLMPQILHIYKTLFNLDLRDTVEVKLALLKSKPTFDLWVSQRTGKSRSIPAAGIYMPQTREVAIWNNGNEAVMIRTILHESSHVIMAQLSPRAPSWLQEGMAEYFENIEMKNDVVVVNLSPQGHRNIRHWLDNGTLITLRKYLSIPEQQWREMAHSANQIPYTVAWGTSYFLLSSETGKTLLRRTLQDLEKSQRWPTIDDIDQHYPGGITRMDFEFFKWAQSDAVAHFYTAKPKVHAEKTDYKAAADPDA
ncbi:MAG: DUF4124 domain-containing protein [Gammaproteobacteria bacterium]|jgi:hypothetical protein|nr:DUF4124 domain-containing protein [Gammaproteobacteria bacterium]MBQ0773181.1 DUF4124 domain-containing protein [Gammaproteobacteria bacterium]